MGASEDRDLDHVGRIMAQWNRERPDLDVSPQGVIGRLHRLAARLTEELVASTASSGWARASSTSSPRCDATGTPYELTPRELAAQTMVSSGAVTKRVDRCVEQGWVTRRVSDHDGRGRVVALTDAGRDVIDRAFAAHMANEHRLVGLLSRRSGPGWPGPLESWGRALDG